MKISTRGRYAIRLVADIASNQTPDTFVSLRKAAQEQGISVKYMEQLVPGMIRKGILISGRGKDGGYRLARAADDIKISEILDCTDSLHPVACLDGDPRTECPKYADCHTIGMWRGFDEVVHEYFSKITVQDILDGKFSAKNEMD